MATLADCLKKTRRFLDPDDYTAIKESYEAAVAQGMDEQTAVNEAVRPILNELLEARASVVDQVDEAVGGNVDEMFAPPEAAPDVAGAEGAAPSTAATDAAVLQDVREFAGDKRNYDGIPADQLDQAINAIGSEIADLIATRNGLQTEIETMQPSKERRAKSREFKQVRADIKALEDELAAMAAARDVLDVEQPAPVDPAARALEEAQTMTETGQPAENWSDAALEAGLDNGLIRIDRDGAPRRAAQPDPEQVAAEQESRIESLMEGQLATLIQDASGEIRSGRLGQQEAVGDAVAIRRLVDSVALLSDDQIKAEFGKVARLARAANRPQLIARAIQGAMARDLRAREDAELSNAARDLIEQSVEDALEGKPVSETLETVMADQVVEGVADEILGITKHMTLDGYTRVADRIAGVLDEIEPEVVSVVEAANDMPSQFSRARAVAEQAQAMGGRIVNVNVSALANDLAQVPRAAGAEYADRLEALRESAGSKKRAYLVESGGQPTLMFPDGTEFRNPPPGSYYDVAAPIAAEASQALLGLIRGVAERIAKKSGVRAPERTIEDMLEAAEGSRAEKIAVVLDEIGTDAGLYHDLTVDYLKEKRGGLTLAELQIVAHTYAGKTTKSRTKKDAIDAIEAEFNRRASAEEDAAVLAGDVGLLTRAGEQRSNTRRAAQRDQRLREGARALSDGGLSEGLPEDGEGRDAGGALAGRGRGSGDTVSDDGAADQGQGDRVGSAIAGGRADTEEPSAAASQRDRDERDRAGAADDDIDIDAPNFGLPEPPRTLPDGHPLLTPHWDPENTELQDTSPERVAMRERLIEQRFEGKAPVADGQKPIAYVMGGGGASGKGTILKALIRDGYIDDSYVQLDPDSFKTGDTKLGWEGIPEYWEIDAAGDSRGAGVTHEESSHTYKQAQARGIAGRYNLVLDQTLGTPHKGQALLKSLNDAGYEVRLIGVTVNPEMAIRRAVDRAKGPERRFVPLNQLLAAHKGFSNGFESYAAAVDSVMLFNTEVPRGADAIQIAQGNREDGLAISDQNAYDKFARKGALNEEANTIRQLRESLEKAGLVQRLQAGHDGAGDQGARGRAEAPRIEDRAGLSRDRVRTAALEAAKQADIEREERRRKNYQITDDDNLGAGGAKAKVRGNIEAIRIVRQLEEEGRPATTEEKQKLVKYVGWGAFAQDVFTDYKSEWAKERQQLKDLMSVEEYNAAKASTLNAHYTSKDVIDGMWKALAHFGFEGGRAIEPAAGIGHFIGLTPKNIAARTDWVAVELDKITGAIAKHLYEGSDVRVQGFETAALPDGFFDLAISNVPFGNFKLEDTKHKGLLIHDYFFAKSLDKVRPGGMVAFITSMGTMDKVDDRVRRLIDAQADLVGAIRLPGGNQGAFKGNAGTDVTTDIIFLRKRVPGEGRNPDAPKWLDLKEIKTPEGKTRINRYFADHPDMMLGKMRLAGTMYRKDSPVLIGPSNNLGERIAEAASKMPANVIAPRATTSQDVGAEPEILTDVGVKEGSLFVKGGKIYQNIQGKAVDQKVSGKNLTRLRGLIAMRDIYTDLLNAQISGKREDAPALREKLNVAYDAFFAKFGPINKTIINVQTRKQKDGSVKEIITRRYPNLAGFNDDPDYFKLASIEHYDEETGKAFKKAVFSEDILAAYERPKVAGPADALAVSLNETGGIDMARIADMMGVTEAEAIAELGDRVYRDPNGERYELAELYLSGDVVKKLEDARAAAETDPSYQRNVTALEAVQPEPLTRVDIRVPFGAPWIPAEIYNEFIAKVIGMRGGNVKYETVLSSWRFETPDKLKYSGYLNVAAQDAFGTDRVNVGDIVIAALNNKTITVKDKDSDGNEFVNVDATEQARAKIKLVQDTFSGDPQIGVLGWAFESEENAQKLEALYNRTYNRLVPTRYDGSHLTLPGLSETLTLPNGKIVPLDRSPHRVNAIWRAITTGNMLMDHAVGSGKTITAIAAVMEMKRLGMIQRPMFAVPNHMLEQFSREFLEAYPNAKILVADKKNMEAKNRKAFAGRIASEKWDGIIITHDAFGRIGMKEEAYAEFMEQEIKELLDAWISAKTAAGEVVNIDEFNAIGTASEKTKGRSKDPTVKQIERKKKTLETQIAKALAKDRKDTGLTFEELGVDYLVVDEAHLFKNLTFNTSHANVKGLGVKGSQRAMDLFLKIRHIEKSRPGRSAIFMTGTPMSRSMAEIYTMQRYLQLDKLREYGIDRFDAWASTFGRIVTNTEQGITMKLKDVASFSKFVNVPELQQIYSLVTDSMTAEQLGLPRPDLKGGAPQVILSEMSEGEVAETERLIAKMEALRGPVKKGEDNHLSLFTKTLQIATDMRLYDASAPFNPNGKIAKLVAKVAEIYKRGEYPALAQTIFLDMGVPTSKAPAKKKGKAKVEDIGDTDADTDADPNAEADAEVEALLAGKFNLYQDIKDRLVAQGIPANEIAFIHDAKTDTAKGKLFKAVREGKVRVLLGSSSKMGVGTNIQSLLVAQHHVDSPWNPADLVQRDGRILRRGNQNKEVEIYRYITERSADAYRWQILARKAEFEAQFRAGARGLREAEDIDSPIPEASTLKALATGDPRILEHANLTREIRDMEAARRGHERSFLNAQRSLKEANERIAKNEVMAIDYGKDAELVTDISGDNFKIRIDTPTLAGETKKRKEAGEAIRAHVIEQARYAYSSREWTTLKVGQMSGLEMIVRFRKTSDGLVIEPALKGAAEYRSNAGTKILTSESNPVGLMRAWENVLIGIPGLHKFVLNRIEEDKATVSQLEKRATPTPFPRADELVAAKVRHEQLEKELKAAAAKPEEAAEAPADIGETKTPTSREAAIAAYTDFYGREPPPRLSIKQMQDQITNDKARWAWQEKALAPLRKGMEDEEDVLSALLPQSLSDRIRSVVGLGREAVKTDAMLGENDDGTPFVGGKEAAFQRDMRLYRLQQTLLEELNAAGRDTGRSAGDSRGADAQGGTAAEGIEAAPAADTGSGQRDALGAAVQDPGFRARAIDAFLSPELRTEAIQARQEAQGWTVDGFHGTRAVFDDPNPFVPGRDFGFHVSIGNAHAANEILNAPTSFTDRMTKLLDRFQHRERGFRTVEEGANVVPLKIRAKNPLRLPHVAVVNGRWNDPFAVRELLRHPESTAPESLKRWADQWIRDNGINDFDRAYAVRGNHIFSRAFAQELERMGYDAIIYKNALEGRGYDSMLLWDASQIRSSYDFFHDDAAGATGLMASLDYVEQDLADRLAGLMAEENMDPNKEAYTFDELSAFDAWHGSPHHFERFSLDKIGTGEGAQAFGWGLYFAGAQATGRFYRDNLAKRGNPFPVVPTSFPDTIAGNIERIAYGSNSLYAAMAIDQGHMYSGNEVMHSDYFGFESDIRDYVRSVDPEIARLFEEEDRYSAIAGSTPPGKRTPDSVWDAWRDVSDKINSRYEELISDGFRDVEWKEPDAEPGALYQVRIDADEERDMLDWDKPLSQQSESVKAAVKKLTGRDVDKGAWKKFHDAIFDALFGNGSTTLPEQPSDPTGAALQDIYGIARDRQSVERLVQLGIKGIRFLDAMSRNNTEKPETYNYVVFDDSIVEVIAKDGKPVDQAARDMVLSALKPGRQGATPAATLTAGNKRFTPEMATAAPAIRNDLEARLRRMLPSNVAVRFADRLFATNGREQLGRFRPEVRLIELALAYGETTTLGAGAHEVVHALRAAGAFTDTEWSALADRARKVVTLEDEATYRDMYGRQARKMGLPEDLARAFVNRRIEEEYVAHLAQRYFSEAKPRFGATIDALLQKIGDILDAIAQAFGAQGFNSPERIFRRMEQGQIAERVEPQRQRAQAPRLPSQIEIDNDVAATKGLWSPAGEPTRAFTVSGRRGSVKITDRADGLQNRVYRVTDEDGNMQAVVALAERDPNLFEVVGVRIAEKARGRGVAIKALKAIEDDLGRPLMQAGIMAADVYEKVAQAMPERVRFHVQGGRAFDGLYLSPRSIDAMDRGAAGAPGDDIAREREIVKRLGAQIPDEHFAIERSVDEMAAFAGINAKTAQPEALTVAEEMERSGKSREEIWAETWDRFNQGWFRGVDGVWRFEVDDSSAKFNRQRGKGWIDNWPISSQGTETAGEAFGHGSLYEAYPDLAGIVFKRFGPVYDPANGAGGVAAYHSAADNEIGLRIRPSRYGAHLTQARSDVLHELQHAIQAREGFPGGANPMTVRRPEVSADEIDTTGDLGEVIKRLGLEINKKKSARDALYQLWDDAFDSPDHRIDDMSVISKAIEQMDEASPSLYELYRRQAGEVEARAVEKRKDMTAAERRARPPWLDYDVSEENQIISYGRGSEAAFRDHLDMSPEARKARAEEMGFDTSRVWYHGTVRWDKGDVKFGDITKFDRLAPSKYLKRQPGMDSVGVWFSDKGDEDGASMYAGSSGELAGAVYPVYLRVTNPWRPASFDEFLDKLNDTAGRARDAKPRGRVSAEPLRAWLRNQGYDGIAFPENTPIDGSKQTIIVALDESQIRSVNAAFDPSESDSADILSALKPRGMKPRPSHLPSLGDMSKSDVNTEASQSLSDLSTLLLEAIGTEARMGRLNPGLKAAMGRMGAKLYGHYSRATGLIRMAIPGDFVTLVHEGGHALENHHDLGQFVEGIKQAYSAELLPFAGIGQDQLSEGWAEWFRYYMTDPRTAQKKAPTVYGAFRTMLEQNSPELLQALDAIQGGYQQAVASSPAGAVILRTKSAKAEGDGIIREVAEKGLRATVSDRLYGLTRDVTDEKHPLKTAVRFLVNEAMKRGIGGQLTKNQKLWMKAIDDPYKLGRMMEHSRTHATAVLQHGVRRKGRSMPSGPSMQDVLKEAFGGLEKKLWSDERFQQFGAYLVARRMNAEWDRFDAGLLEGAPDHLISRDAWGKAQNDLEQAFPEFKRAARKFDIFMSNLLEWKYENGFLTDEQYDELSLRDGYAPLNRVFKNEGPSSLKAKGDNRRKIIYRFRGSTRDFINPIESVIQDVYQTQARVELNDVVKALDKLARNAGPNGGLIAERLPAKDIRATEMDLTKVHDEMKREAQNILEREARAGTIAKWDVDSILDKLDTLFDQNAAQTLFSAVDTQSKKGERIVYLWENGKRVPILLGSDMLGEDIFNIFASVGKPSDLGIGLEWAVFGTQLFRAGVTKSPAYIAVNWFRDQLATWALSKHFTPFWTGLKGVGQMVKGQDIVQMYQYWAGMMGGIDANLIDQMGRERDALTLRKSGFLAAPSKWQSFLRVMETTEAASRIGHMKQAYDNYIAQGFSEEEAAFEAAYNAHDVMDFSMHGSRMMQASRLVAFLNAQLQGMYAALRTMKGERDDVVTIRDAISPYLKATEGQPLTVVEKAALPNSTAIYLKLVSIGLIGLALALTYRDDPEYEELSKGDMGFTHWFFKINGTWWRVPKPFELAIFSNLFETMFEKLAKDDDKAVQRFLLSIRETMGFTPEMQAFSAIQTAYQGGRGLLNTVTGKPQYGNPKDDLPMRMRGLPPEMQWDAYTSEFSKMLAATFGISAYKTDRVIRELTASVGRDLLTVSDYVLPRVNMATGGAIPGVEKQPRADKSFEDKIFLSRITRRAARGSYSATHFWQDMNADNGRFVMAAKGYKDMMDSKKQPREAQQFLMSLPDEERAYAILEYHYKEKDQDMHPLNRAKQVIQAINAVRRGLANNNLYVEKTNKKGREAKPILVPPSEQRVLNEILEDIAMREARNSQIVLGKPGWSQAEIMATDGLWKELHAASPEVAEELYWRLTHGRYNTYSFEAVKKVWPEVRQQLLTETPGTSLAGSRSDARIETPRVLPLGP